MCGDIVGQVILNRYRVDAFIAAGGMGAVYRIWDLARSVPLAMKVLHEDLKDDATIWKMFHREADALIKLAHPHIVPFYGLFETPTFAFFLEYYVDGLSLKEILRERRGAPLAIPEALTLLKALCAALGYAHVNGIIHCDIKPGNVLMDKSGGIFLTDFGIARHTSSTTTTMASAGTPAYMAPEQIGGEPVSPATDVYSLGILLFEMLTGRRPFLGNEPESEEYGPSTDQRIYYAHLSLPPPDPARFNPQVPDALGQVVKKAMEKKPDQRYASTAEMLQAACEAAGMNPAALPTHLGISGVLPVQAAANALPVTTPNRPAAWNVDYSIPLNETFAAQPPANSPRKRWPYWLAAGAVVACLALAALAAVGVALWRQVNPVVLGIQTTQWPGQQTGGPLIPTETSSGLIQPGSTQTFTSPPNPPASTDTQRPSATLPPTLTPTVQKEAFLAPLYSPIPGCAPSHVHKKDWTMITLGTGYNAIRSTPDTHPADNKIGIAEPGELIYVIDGPECNYGWLLWKVRTATGLEGWTPETDGKRFFLEPFPTWEACSNSPHSLLRKGDQAQVTLYPPAANRLRVEPSIAAEQTGIVNPGKNVTLLDGPKCADGYVWWKVQDEMGQTGWTAEGDQDSYFMVPIPKLH